MIENENTIHTFDKTEAYQMVKPLIRKVIDICSANDIPMFFTACVKYDGHQSKYVNESVTPKSHGVVLSQDRFSDHIAVTIGFNTVPPVERPDISYDDAEE